MNANFKVKQAQQLATTAPVLVVGCPRELFGAATVLPADLPSRELGIVNTAHGLQYPAWLDAIRHHTASQQIIIDGIDTLDYEAQTKFNELLQYQTISSIELPRGCTIIVLAADLTRVAEPILRQCLVVQ